MEFVRPGLYLGAKQAGKVALIGAPLDQTTSFRPGTRFAPGRVREASQNLEEYSPILDKELKDASFSDLGDIELVPGQLQENLRLIEESVAHLAKAGHIPLVIGGEHLVSLPIVKSLLPMYPDLLFIQLDAHADLRPNYLGHKYSHASVVRLIADLIGGQKIYQFGIRSGTKEEFAYGRNNTHFFPEKVLTPLNECLLEISKFPIYLSIDIDVVDPAYAPGTGTAEPGGITTKELFQSLYLLKGLNLVGMDIVELCPPVDFSDITAMLVAKLIREACLIWG